LDSRRCIQGKRCGCCGRVTCCAAFSLFSKRGNRERKKHPLANVRLTTGPTVGRLTFYRHRQSRNEKIRVDDGKYGGLIQCYSSSATAMIICISSNSIGSKTQSDAFATTLYWNRLLKNRRIILENLHDLHHSLVCFSSGGLLDICSTVFRKRLEGHQKSLSLIPS
jgi:hypothetical protein